MSRAKKLGIWLACGLLVGAVVPISLAIALRGGDDSTANDGATSSDTSGAVGVELSDDQMDDLHSGDAKKQAKILNKVYIPKLEKALSSGKGLDRFTSDPDALRQLNGLSEDALSKVAGDTEPYIAICPTVITSKYEDGPCDGRPSVLNDHEDVVLQVNVDSFEKIAGVSVKYTLPGVSAFWDGDKVVLN